MNANSIHRVSSFFVQCYVPSMAAHGKVWEAEIEKFEPVSHECLSTVRVLHRTVVCLRKALEKSRNELNLLKDKVQAVPTNPVYNATIEQLSLENHVLRRKILSSKRFDHCFVSMDDDTDADADDSKRTVSLTKSSPDQNAALPAVANGDRADISSSEPKSISDESEEVDDIELIFTNDDSTRIEVLEELEPIRDDGDASDAAASKSDISRSLISNRSVLVETDISKCGIVYREEDDAVASLNPVQFRRSAKQTAPVIKTSSRHTPLRIVASAFRDSEAQTDISAVPQHWKSESFLADNKTLPNFPTLPSKFAIPDTSTSKCPLSLTEKTQEARRTLLSDINFTSMVPELSRSVDHLCQSDDRPQNATVAAATSSSGPSGQSAMAMKWIRSPALLSAGSSYSKFDFAGITGGSSTMWTRYEQNRSTQDLSVRRKLLWRPSIYSLDAYFGSRTSSVPPSPTTRRHSAAITCVADSQFCDILPDKLNTKTLSNVTLRNGCRCGRKSDPKVAFKDVYFSKNNRSRQSLPNMCVDIESGEESTESLIDESEECVRRTINTTFSSTEWPLVGYHYAKRTFSVPNLFLEFSPPLSATPFIARSPQDLKINYFVKVINKDGRVVGGRIQYVGTIAGKTDSYVGILVPSNVGETDGTFQGFKYFSCDQNCGLYAPFRKVVMAWKV